MTMGPESKTIFKTDRSTNGTRKRDTKLEAKKSAKADKLVPVKQTAIKNETSSDSDHNQAYHIAK